MINHRQIVSATALSLMLQRLSLQLLENYDNFENFALIGLQPKGRLVVDKLIILLENVTQQTIQKGYIDYTFFRDDFRKPNHTFQVNKTNIDFVLEDKKVVLVDDVLYTGRSVRATLTAIHSFGRPSKVELMVLIDRRFSRHFPIQADYIGRIVHTMPEERVAVKFKEQKGVKKEGIWIEKLANKDDKNR